MKFAGLAGRVLPLLMGISATAAQEDIALGSWHCIGPFKDEAFGNIARSLETRFGPEVDTFGDDPADEGLDPVNLATGARASSPDGIPAEKASDAPAAAVDGNPATFWDDRDGAAAYVLRLTFPEPRTFNELAADPDAALADAFPP